MKKLLLIIFVTSYYSFSNATSFDCSKASSPVEKTICSNSNLSNLDDKLAQVYADAIKNSSNPNQLKMDELNWLKNTKTCLTDVNCIEKAYRARISALTETSNKSPIPPPINATQDNKTPVNTQTNYVKLERDINCAVVYTFSYKLLQIALDRLSNSQLKANGLNPEALNVMINDYKKYDDLYASMVLKQATTEQNKKFILENNDKYNEIYTNLYKKDGYSTVSQELEKQRKKCEAN